MMYQDLISPKRKETETHEDETPAIKWNKIWGTTREDLETTWISMTKDRNTFSEVVFEKVFFGNKTAYIEKTGGSLWDDLGIPDETMEDMKTKLEPLKQTIKPLACLKSLTPGMKGTWGCLRDFERLPPGLSEKLWSAFIDDMADSSGKLALRDLLTDVVQRLNLDDTLSVASTGSRSRMSRFATCISTKVTTEVSSDCSDCFINSRNRVDAIDAVPSASSSSISPSYTKPKLYTSDVLVYSYPDGMTGPLRAHLVVSINKGRMVHQVDIVQELLSRLPYQHQFGKIYGLLINSCMANFYSVEYDNKGKPPLVNVVDYLPIDFKVFGRNQNFDIEAFWKFLLSIAKILKSQSENSNP